MRDFATMFFRRQTGAPAAGTPKNFHYWLSLCLVGTLLRLPALSVTYAPLVDYPNHLARVYIHGRRTWLVLPCCFFIYNSLFLYGFVNYNLGVSFFCLAFAYWLRRRENWTWLSLLASSVLVFCCYLAHLSAYAFLGVSFVVVEAWYFAFRRVSPRSVALGLIPLIPSLLTFAVFMRGSGRIGTIQWNTPAGAAKYLLIAYLVIASIRLGAIWNTWMTLDRRIAAEVERLKGLPQGSSVYVAFTQPAIGEKGKVERAFEHIAHYARTGLPC
jgi:hypothetical protein